MRERGLKLVARSARFQPFRVAPHAGAWIETLKIGSINCALCVSLPMRERGLKLLWNIKG